MDGVALVLLVIGVVLLVVGFQNHQDNLLTAFAGKPVGNPTLK